VSGPPALRLEGLAKRFGRRIALAGVDLALEGAALVGVVGPDGAGKTTLLRAIAGLLTVEARTATVLGVDLRDDVRALKRRVGYVPQVFALHRELSVLENLRFTARLHRLPGDVFARRAGELLERTGLAPFRDRPAGALSGGMKQKLAVANALLPEPALLVLDEPTAGVDLANQRALAATLERLVADGATVVLVAHELGPLAPLVDRAVVMRDGRIAYDGPPAGLPVDSHGGDHHHPHEDHYLAPSNAPETASPVDRLSEPPEHGEVP